MKLDFTIIVVYLNTNLEMEVMPVRVSQVGHRVWSLRVSVESDFLEGNPDHGFLKSKEFSLRLRGYLLFECCRVGHGLKIRS